MAKLAGSILFTGTLGDLSAYTMKGVDHIVVRRKGGASKQKVKSSPAFANTRRLNEEFSGRAKAASLIMSALLPVKPMADFNIAGALNALIFHVQKADTISEWGKRSIELSQMPQLLAGFSLNKKNTLDGMLRCSYPLHVVKEELKATVSLPDLVPGINLVTPPGKQYLSFVLSIGVVPDLAFTDSSLRYQPIIPERQDMASAQCPAHYATPWLLATSPIPAHTLETKIDLPAPENMTLVVSLGIRFGVPDQNGEIVQERHAGCAKIIAAL